MNILNNRHSRRFIVLGLIFFVSIFFVSSTLASEDVCKKAMSRCTADAVKTGLLSGAQSFLLYYAGCFMGYSWCLKYYEPQI
jgi:uncharacterized BrkB/YihY/UPF0761 family membrane protein